jgi:hypothetical protein
VANTCGTIPENLVGTPYTLFEPNLNTNSLLDDPRDVTGSREPEESTHQDWAGPTPLKTLNGSLKVGALVYE